MPVPARAPVPLRIVDNHLLFDRNGETCLLDTGVPWSMPAPDMVSDALGVRVDTLIGCEDIREQPITIDWPGGELRAGRAHGSPYLTTVPLGRALFGVPTIDIDTASGRAVAIFDTGAALSYAPGRAVAGLPVVRATSDFLPGYGTFDVEVHRVPLSVGGMALELECAELPPVLQAALALIAPDGWIVGTGLLANRLTTIDLGGGLLHLSPTRVATDAADLPDSMPASLT